MRADLKNQDPGRLKGAPGKVLSCAGGTFIVARGNIQIAASFYEACLILKRQQRAPSLRSQYEHIELYGGPYIGQKEGAVFCRQAVAVGDRGQRSQRPRRRQVRLPQKGQPLLRRACGR